MEIRRIQLTGGSSYVVTLPKGWVTSRGLKKNDPVVLVDLPDGTLLVNPHVNGDQIARVKTIDTSRIDDSTYLFRLLVGSYMMGYTQIELRGKGPLSGSVRDVVRRFTQTAIGPEIVEESSNHIVMKDLLNPTEMPFEKTVRRMHVLVRTMHEDAVTALKRDDAEMARDVISRDMEINRLHWLVAHQHRIVTRDVNLARRMQITLEDADFYFSLSRVLERIGDHAGIISKHAQALMGRRASKLVSAVSAASDSAQGLLAQSVNAWFRKDIQLANGTIESVSEVVERCEAIDAMASKREDVPPLAVGYIAESIRRTAEYSGDIGELVINNLIREV